MKDDDKMNITHNEDVIIFRWINKHIGAALGSAAAIAALCFSYAYMVFQVADITEVKKDLKETRDHVIELKTTINHMSKTLDSINARTKEK